MSRGQFDAGRELRLEDLEYDLPDDLVAQAPAEPRDASRLLVYDRAGDLVQDRRFADLPGLLRPGDVLVRNDTRVFPARAHFRRATGGRVEALFLHPVRREGGDVWEVLLRGKPRAGETVVNEALAEWRVCCERPLGDGRWVVASLGPRRVLDLLEEAGVTPLPPYIHGAVDDPERYQTIYARVVGSAAAPTAGLHFSPAVDGALADAGVVIETVTLHVGLGTFRPLREETLAAGVLHRESYEVDAAAWRRLRTAVSEGRRIVAVGTTSLRVLETLARRTWPDAQAPARGVLAGTTDLFIAPGFEFAMTGGLLTNFHLPRTSLLALVMAFCGVARTRALYAHAVRERYRFYSFGDAMLAL